MAELQVPSLDYASFEEPMPEEPTLEQLPAGPQGPTSFATQAAQNVYGDPAPLQAPSGGNIKGGPPRGKFDALIRGNLTDTMKNLSGQMGKRKRHVELKKQFENILSMQERGADVILADAMETLGPEVKDYMPPKELFVDPKTGTFNALEYAKRAYIAIKKFKEDKAKTAQGRKEMLARAKDWGNLRTFREKGPQTREEGLGIVEEAYADMPPEDLPSKIGPVTEKYLGSLQTAAQRKAAAARAARSAKEDEPDVLNPVEITRVEKKIAGGKDLLGINEKENSKLTQRNEELQQELDGQNEILADMTPDEDPSEIEKAIRRIEDQMTANSRKIAKNKMDDPTIDEEMERQIEILKRYKETGGSLNTAQIEAALDEEKKEKEKNPNYRMIQRLKRKKAEREAAGKSYEGRVTAPPEPTGGLQTPEADSLQTPVAPDMSKFKIGGVRKRQ